MGVRLKVNARFFTYCLSVKYRYVDASTKPDQFRYIWDNSLVVRNIHSKFIIGAAFAYKAVLNVYYYKRWINVMSLDIDNCHIDIRKSNCINKFEVANYSLAATSML